jgi:hypothetical protein
MSEAIEYQIGKGFMNRIPIWVGYKPAANDIDCPEAIVVAMDEGRHRDGKCLSAKGMLEFRWRSDIWIESPNGRRYGGEKVESDWFKHKCKEANCEWFVPMVERMADGETVPIEEIQAAYIAHNGRPMPCGKWQELFRE